jgi:cytochrome b
VTGTIMTTVAHDRASVRVWSPYVRLFHWSLAACVAVAWLSSDEARGLHEYAGYAVFVLVSWRVVAGLAGSGYTRFGQFVRRPETILRYLREILAGRERRYIGHNPAGGAMVVTLLACLIGIAITGWMQTSDAFWGVEWVETLHRVLGNGIVVLVGLHVLGVILASVRHRENLIRAMLSGRKRAARGSDVA